LDDYKTVNNTQSTSIRKDQTKHNNNKVNMHTLLMNSSTKNQNEMIHNCDINNDNFKHTNKNNQNLMKENNDDNINNLIVDDFHHEFQGNNKNTQNHNIFDKTNNLDEYRMTWPYLNEDIKEKHPQTCSTFNN
jgi:hypothetical protein